MKNEMIDYLEKEASSLREIAKEVQNEVEKRERLQKLGFVNTKTNEIGLDAEIAEQITKLSERYPLYKFLTKKQINILCEKWGLVYGPIDKYKGEIPDKNLKEIEDFNVDERYLVIIYNSKLENIHWNINDHMDEFNPKDQQKLLRGEKIGNPNSWEYSINSLNEIKTERMTIIAPLNMFKKKGMTISKHELKRKPIKNDDPIVIVKIKKGIYGVMTAWGAEATDSLLL